MRTQKARPPSPEKSHSSFVDSVPRNDRHIALLYKSRAQSELYTSPRGIAATRMLPYLVASGHNLYVKCLGLYIPTAVVKDAHLGCSQSDCRKKSRDGLSTNQIPGFGGVVKQDGGSNGGVVTRPAGVSRGVSRSF